MNGKVKEAVLGNTGRYVYFPTSEKPDSVQNFSNNNLSAVNKYIYESNKIISNIYTYNGPTQTYYGNRTFVTNLSNNVESLTFNYTSTSIYNYTYDDKKGISKLVGVIVPDIFTFDFSFESYLTANNIIGRTSSGTPGANYSAVYTYDADGYPLTRNVIFETGNKVNTVYKYEIL